MPQFLSTAGVCIGYFICYGTTLLDSSFSWRAPYIVQTFIALIFAGCYFVLPESPRWLVSTGKQLQAVKAFETLGIPMSEVEQSFLRQPAQENPSMSFGQSFLLLFRRAYRARTILALFLLGMVQLSGIDGVLYVCTMSTLCDVMVMRFHTDRS